jgi:hypothetical protein
MPGEEVRMEVSEKHVPDPAAQPVGVLDVLIDIALRINHRRDPPALVGHEVGGVGQAAEVVLP